LIKRLHLPFTVFIIIAGLTGVTGKPRSADEIIHKYMRARGGYKRLKAIKTLWMTGTYQEGKNTFGTYIEWKRPWFRVVVVGVPDEVYFEGFNGASWEYSLPTKSLKITEPSSARTGAILNTLHWKEIEANGEIDDRQFNPPTGLC